MSALPLFISVREVLQVPNAVLVDVRSRVEHGWDALGAYAQGHAVGARFLPFDQVFAGEPVLQLGRHPWPERREVVKRIFGLLGCNADPAARLVFYDDGGMNFAARAALCARWAGFANAQILDGGLPAWRRAGLPLEEGLNGANALEHTKEAVDAFMRAMAPAPAPRILGKAEFHGLWKSGCLVVDGRPRERFAGKTETLDSRPGHVPGAVGRAAPANMDAAGCLKAIPELRAEWLAVLNGRDPKDVVQMCGSGVAACLNAAALDAAGILPAAEAIIYVGSWSQWAADPALPAETGYRDQAEAL